MYIEWINLNLNLIIFEVTWLEYGIYEIYNYLDAELPNAKHRKQIFSFQDRRLVQPDVSDSSMSIWSVVVLIFGYLDQILGIKYARYHKIRQYRLTKVQEFIYMLLCDKFQLGWVACIINIRWA